MLLWVHIRDKFVHGFKYTPLYKKAIKESQNEPMEITKVPQRGKIMKN